MKLFDYMPENGRAIGLSMALFGLALPFSAVGTFKALADAGLLGLTALVFFACGLALLFGHPTPRLKRLLLVPWLVYPMVTMVLALFQQASLPPAAMVLYFSLFYLSWRETF